ncbi:hypothetical protein B0T21DRAFT_345072 [Apiosordaria backusii]|uniref:Uncharacterized protein n=1 Tax=Apiosordaria backusii TaxID=314023 RepID=A0AA40ET28_9PEZI|nr:hypothetical protein B0T21DRAFT_345072 [Apiosordaria backusii]
MTSSNDNSSRTQDQNNENGDIAHTPPKVRYSTATVTPGSQAAEQFKWEMPVPVNSFWDSISYCLARSFLSIFPEIPPVIDSNSNAPNEEKFSLLLGLLRARLSELKRDSQASSGKGLADTSHAKWEELQRAIFGFQAELQLLEEGEQTMKLLLRHRKNGDFSLLHIYADWLIKRGDYRQAEEVEMQVVKAWDKWDRMEEARGLMKEIEEIVEGMDADGSRFGMYKMEERRLNQDMVRELEGVVA